MYMGMEMVMVMTNDPRTIGASFVLGIEPSQKHLCSLRQQGRGLNRAVQCLNPEYKRGSINFLIDYLYLSFSKCI